jgi:hypothetical protein
MNANPPQYDAILALWAFQGIRKKKSLQNANFEVSLDSFF